MDDPMMMGICFFMGYLHFECTPFDRITYRETISVISGFFINYLDTKLH